MELKKYQKKVIADLTQYMELLDESQSISGAYQKFWEEKGITFGVNDDDVLPYQDIIPGVPDLCFKVPTGGGKTFLACNSIKPIFDGLPPTKIKAVVWLVPSDAILEQTIKALKDPYHPYRQKLDVDFGGRVEIYSKDELQNGQNFNPTVVCEQLSVFVLSYDSFRGKKETLKSRQENSNLEPFHKALGEPDHPVPDVDETALLQIINQLSPLVIVDESHHARSTLSLEMLRNFNPCFVLDLTATPLKQSNIISFVDAIQLKKENMVKLPVIVYNRNSQKDVLSDAVDMRRNLEKLAAEEQNHGGEYIRPIVLLQAQPKISCKSTGYEKLKEKLVDAGIPKEHIAIKTAEIDELKNAGDLMSPDCQIRYIITVNALKEGWDCPFAYILATLANKTSPVDVEQILGRVLRQPYTHRFNSIALNSSYVLTSSNDFHATLDNVVKSLQGVGFTERDCRAVEEPQPSQANQLPETQREQEKIKEAPSVPNNDGKEGFLNFDPAAVKKQIETNASKPTHTKDLLDSAARIQEQYERLIHEQDNQDYSDVPMEMKKKLKPAKIRKEVEREALALEIPQFFLFVPESTFFAQGNTKVLLTKEALSNGFTLLGKPYDIDFGAVDSEIRKIDIEQGEKNKPHIFKMSESDQKYMRKYFSSLPPENRKRTCGDIIFHRLNKFNNIDSKELRQYISEIIEMMDKDTLYAMEKTPLGFAQKIKKFIIQLLSKYEEQRFSDLLETGEIVCEPSYHFHKSIAPLKRASLYLFNTQMTHRNAKIEKKNTCSSRLINFDIFSSYIHSLYFC